MAEPTNQNPKPGIVQLISDGWANLLTNLGVGGRDRRKSTSFAYSRVLQQTELTNIYRSDGFGKRIIELPAGEMVREWFEVEGDPDGVINDRLTELKFKAKLKAMISWADLYGGAIAVMVVDDGNPLEAALNEATVRSIVDFTVYDRHQVTWTNTDLYADPNLPKFQQNEFYTITPVNGGQPFRVHETRCLRLDGAVLPDHARQLNDGWGDSKIQRCYERLVGLGSAYASVDLILEEFITGVLTVKGLSSLLAAGKEDLIVKRMNIIDRSRHILNTSILDEGETYEKRTSSVAGLADLLDREALALSAVSEIPNTLLMSQSPAGLNATGDSDIRFFYDNIAAKQEDRLNPIVQRVIGLLLLAKDEKLQGVETDWKLRWNPLWQLTGLEEAEMHKNQADADKVYLELGVLTGDEVAEARFGGDQYSLHTELNDEGRKMRAELEKVTEPIPAEEE